MQRISTHIEKLLFFNDCVIIPDFGGFVLQMHQAVYVSTNHQFSPPYRDIVFNPTLKHNDGLLSQAYMKTYNIDFNEASVAVKMDVEALKKELNNNGFISLGNIGTFKKLNDSFVFEPAATISALNVSSYGLTSFYLPPVSVLKNDVPSGKITHGFSSTHTITGPVINFPSVIKVISHIAGIAAAVILLFLVISTPVKDVNKNAYSASFIPSELVSKQLIIETKIPTEYIEKAYSDLSVTSQSIALTDTTEQSVVNPHDTSINHSRPIEGVEENEKKQFPEMEYVSPKTYYVIVASFATENQLRKYISSTDLSLLKNAGIVKNEERVRLYAEKTVNRRDAEDYIKLLRDDQKYKDAWLFIGR